MIKYQNLKCNTHISTMHNDLAEWKTITGTKRTVVTLPQKQVLSDKHNNAQHNGQLEH